MTQAVDLYRQKKGADSLCRFSTALVTSELFGRLRTYLSHHLFLVNIFAKPSEYICTDEMLKQLPMGTISGHK